MLFEPKFTGLVIEVIHTQLEWDDFAFFFLFKNAVGEFRKGLSMHLLRG